MSLKQIIFAFIYTGLILVVSSCDKTEEFEAPVLPSDVVNNDSLGNRGFIYTCNKTGNFEIWKSDHESEVQVTNSSDHDSWWPRYCTSTDRILYYRSTSGRDINDFDNAELWVMDSDGSNASALILDGDNGWEKQGLADWSPDGSRIMMSAVDREIGTWQLYITDENGTLIERVSTRDDVHHLDPVFSTDGNAIYYVSCPEGEENIDRNFEVYRMDLDSREEERLTFNDYPDHNPHPSPDGTRIVYSSLIDPNYLAIGKWTIHELDLENSSVSTLIDDDNINLFARYSVEGDRVYFTCLNVETFGMKIASYDLTSEESTYLINEYYNALNVDPF